MLAQLQAAVSERWYEHIAETFLGAGVPAILWMMDNRRRARNQAREEQTKIRVELDKKHAENTRRLNHQDEKLDEILEREKYIPSHLHRELNGPLKAEGIHYPKK